MTDNNYIHRYAENLGHGRGIMRVDIVVHGKLVNSHLEGSPAPIETVRAHESKHMIGDKLADDHGNTIAQEGCDRCFCGCKYWEFDRCVDCGTHISEINKENR
jgi:hypothetical protein